MKIVIADCSWGSIDIEKKFLPREAQVIACQCKTENELLEVCRDADAVLSEYAPFTRSVLKEMKKCKIISNTAVGVDNIDIKAATEYHIAVANVPDYCINEVADHTIALLLAANRNIVQYDRSVRENLWDIDVVPSMKRLNGQVLGLVGFGKIAQKVALRAMAFGLSVITYSPSIKADFINAHNVKPVDIDELLRESDIISSHMPLTEKTKDFFNKQTFSRMKKNPIFINTSRGKVVNETDLIEALKKGILRAAALDVLADEPPCFDSEIFKMDNVIITPHVGFYSEDALEEVRRRSALNITHFFNKKYDMINMLNLNSKDL
ncbi:C-terminal binding protein [Fusibacter ferrireducens]|uniref:C-terminal binding protein n=1 Tax=Fusibacter ferrireducens TaxID=2785058 RepID=A0ABR9ZTZ9_9FIRM|nr:C-terminal binding protein [Fusibacter ferrireducens]MBF4693943.1 C-terminal binding protein [Fusibacter ferrireducens]